MKKPFTHKLCQLESRFQDYRRKILVIVDNQHAIWIYNIFLITLWLTQIITVYGHLDTAQLATAQLATTQLATAQLAKF